MTRAMPREALEGQRGELVRDAGFAAHEPALRQNGGPRLYGSVGPATGGRDVPGGTRSWILKVGQGFVTLESIVTASDYGADHAAAVSRISRSRSPFPCIIWYVHHTSIGFQGINPF